MNPDWILPVLILLPFLAAPLPLVLGRIHRLGRLTDAGWYIVGAVLTLEAALAAWLAHSVYTSSSIIYQVGGATLSRPDTFAIGIELLADEMAMILVLMIALVALGSLSFARNTDWHTNAFYSGYLLITGGLMGMVLTHDVFNLFVFMEITGIATYALISSNRTGRSAVAALKYLLIGTVGASLYLIGVGYLYMATGTLNMTDLAQVLAGEGFIDDPLYGNPLVRTGFAFIAAGLLIKAAIFPLHTWQPGAYDAAPDDVTTYVAALVSTAGAYALARITFTVFTPAFFAVNPIAAEALIGIASLSIVAGSLLAVSQRKVKRMLAYSSVSQFGIIVAAFGVAAHPAGNPLALVGGVIHLAGHSLMKTGLFLGAGIVAARYGIRRVNEFAGLAQRFPIGAGALAVLGIALVGIPPSIGFIGKWYIAVGSVQSGIWPVAALILFSTMLTLLYVARLLETMYHTPGNHTNGEVAARFQEYETPATSMRTAALVTLIAATMIAIVLGFAGQPLHDLLTPFTTEVFPDG